MSVVNNNLLLAADAGVSQYQISRSLRFNSADSAYLSRTPSVAGNQKTWTWAGWAKLVDLSTASVGWFLSATAGGGSTEWFRFNNGKLSYVLFNGSTFLSNLEPAAVYRDPSAWYHIVLAVDTTQATASNRVKLYVNGVQVTSFSTEIYPSQNTNTYFNSTALNLIGKESRGADYSNKYLADVHFIDGQALTPSSFTETNATTGQLVPKAYTGTYGTNGFRLNFSDNSAATLYTLGADSRTDGALNGNNGTLVNGPTYSSANGGSIVFDGSNDYVSLPNLGISAAGARTFSIWMKASSIASIRTLMGFGISGSALQACILHMSAVSSGDIYWAFNNADFYTSGNVINTSQYYHICCTYNGGVLNTSNVSIYINGVLQSLSTAGAFIGSTPNTPNSNYQISGDFGVRYFPGNIPQASIYNRALSASEVTQNYNALVGRFGGTSTGSIVTDGMVLNLDAGNTASYPGTGTTWTDISLRKNNWTPNNFSVASTILNGNNATLVNGPTYNSANGGSIVFDGVDDYVTVPIAKPASMPITFEFWINSTTATPIGLFDSAPGQPYVLRNFGYGQIDWWDGSPFVSMGLTANTWYHIVAVFRFDTYRTIDYYRNGVWISTTVATGGYSTNPDFAWTTFRLGNINGSSSYAYSGKLAKFAIYKKALSAVEVLQNYNALAGRFGGTSSGGIVTDRLILNLDAGNPASYPGTGTTWTDISTKPSDPGIDSLTDTPTSYGTDTGAGGEVRGNYCTWNPLLKGSTLTMSNGNLDLSTSSFQSTFATIPYPQTGKWYYEFSYSGTNQALPGIASLTADLASAVNTFYTNPILSYAYFDDNGVKVLGPGNNSITYGASWVTGDIIGVAFDADNGTLTFYKNGVSQGTAFSGLTGTYVAAITQNSGPSFTNFGQRPFAYAAPSGFKALCDTNLPTPTIAKGSSVFDTVLYTGNSSTQSISTLNFSPDLIWGKARNATYFNTLQDTVRGAGLKILYPNSTDAENAYGQNWINSFDSNGFSMLSGFYNESAKTYAAWCWDAGSSTVTNTAGTITSQVRANSSAGFSVVTFTCPASGAYSFGHGLGVSPAMVIIKDRVIGSTTFWCVYHSSATSISQFLTLNTTDAIATASGVWGSAITSTVVGSTANIGIFANSTAVAYCFAPVTGYSAFGSYTGNGSADGPFVYLGFRPAFLMMKRTNAAGNWVMLDNKRAGYNIDNDPLYANLTNAEATTDLLDITSNGFKLRSTNADVNASAGTYIYAAFAENPFQYARAR